MKGGSIKLVSLTGIRQGMSHEITLSKKMYPSKSIVPPVKKINPRE